MAAILVFLAIYAPLLQIANTTVDIQFIFFVILFIYQAGIHTSSTKVHLRIFPVKILTSIILYSTLVSIAYLLAGAAYLHTILRPIRAIVTLLGSIAVFEYIYRIHKLNYIDKLLELTLLAVTMHGVIMIFQLLYPAFRDFIYQYTVSDRALIGARYYYSMAGLSNGGGAQLSVYQSLGVIIAPLYYLNAPTNKRLFMASLALLICLLSVLITGRTGIFIAAIATPIVILLNIKKKTAWKYLLSLIAILTVLFIFVPASGFIQDDSKLEFSNTIERLRTIDESFESTSDALSSHWFLPNDEITLLIGQPRLIGPDQSGEDRLVKSDIGYIRILHGYGIVGSILHYIFYLYIIYIGWLKLQLSIPSRRILCEFNIILAFIILAAQAKEVFVFTRIGFTFTCLFALALFSEKIYVNRRDFDNV